MIRARQDIEREVLELLTIEHLRQHAEGCASERGDACTCKARQLRTGLALLSATAPESVREAAACRR